MTKNPTGTLLNVLVQVSIDARKRNDYSKTHIDFKTSFGSMGSAPDGHGNFHLGTPVFGIQSECVPIGNETIVSPEVVAREHANGRAIKLRTDGVRAVFDFAGNHVSTERVKGYFARQILPPNAPNDDYCGYCGHSNGPNGEFRQGYDCQNCGGN